MMHPKPYISYSQLVLWENNPEEYLEKYLRGKLGRTNRGQALGKEVAEALEKDEDTGNVELDLVIAMLPKYTLRDQVTRVKMSIGRGRERSFVPILMRVDSLASDYMRFYEYKTGSGPWTQKMVDEDDQMMFYTTGLYLKAVERGQVMIPTSDLFWAPTEKRVDEDGIERPHLTGEIKRFPTKRTYVQVLQMQARISKAWREIGEAVAKEML